MQVFFLFFLFKLPQSSGSCLQAGSEEPGGGRFSEIPSEIFSLQAVWMHFCRNYLTICQIDWTSYSFLSRTPDLAWHFSQKQVFRRGSSPPGSEIVSALSTEVFHTLPFSIWAQRGLIHGFIHIIHQKQLKTEAILPRWKMEQLFCSFCKKLTGCGNLRICYWLSSCEFICLIVWQ